MTKLINNYVIFSFDNQHDLHARATFYRHLDTLMASQKLNKKFIACGIGSYCWEVEDCVMMDYNDFFDHVHGTDWVRNQESVLIVNPKNYRMVSQQGTLMYFDSREDKYLGEVKDAVMGIDHSWTYINNRLFKFGD